MMRLRGDSQGSLHSFEHFFDFVRISYTAYSSRILFQCLIQIVIAKFEIRQTRENLAGIQTICILRLFEGDLNKRSWYRVMQQFNQLVREANAFGFVLFRIVLGRNRGENLR